MFDVKKIREDFPILKRKINGHDLVYLDSAATSQKPKAVIDAFGCYYRDHNANAHRGVHTLAEESTEIYEKSRETVAKFINARSVREIIFVRNSTEALNIVAASYGKSILREGDEILLTEMEHHSNIVPWQLVAREVGAVVRYVPFDAQGELNMSQFKDQISKKTRIISLVHVSNSLGTINPIKEVVKLAHGTGAIVVVDGAQSVPHSGVDVQSLDVDFLAFSGHKMLGPMGIGVLYGKLNLLELMPPFLGGGDMIRTVTLEKSTWNDVPYKFEAGTPNVAGAYGLAQAVYYLEGLGMENIRDHEVEITSYALNRLRGVSGIQLYGPVDSVKRGGLVSFNIEGIHAHDLASILDGEGIALRSGHHCTMPVHTKLGISASARASFYIYNQKEEVDLLIEGLNKAKKIFKVG